MQRAVTAGLFSIWLMFFSSAASAHSLYIVDHPDSAVNQTSIQTLFRNGTFLRNESNLLEGWIAGYRVDYPDGSEATDATLDFSTAQPTLSFSNQGSGVYLLSGATRTRVVIQDGQTFEDYLALEGLHDAKTERAELGENETAVVERYTKWAKRIHRVGEAVHGDYSQRLGHTAEFVPLQDPIGLQVGSTFKGKLFVEDQPAINRLVYAGYAEFAEEVMLRTNGEGEFEFVITQPGAWYVRHIALTRTGDSAYWYSDLLVWLGAQEVQIPYTSHWATLTFDVQ